MVQISRRIERIEETLAVEREKMRKPLTEHLQNSRALARDHATAVSAIVLAGQPQIEEPLGQAWARALQHYDVDVSSDPGSLKGQVEAAQRLISKIVGYDRKTSRLTEIFKTAPGWLLRFTAMQFDAAILDFRLPHKSESIKWGTAGYEESQQWPLLPSGTMADGDPVPDKQARLWPIPLNVTEQAKPPPDDGNEIEADSSADAYLDLLEDSKLALDLAENPQMENDLSRYRRLRLLRLFERFSNSAE